jgi:hypothetical protein
MLGRPPKGHPPAWSDSPPHGRAGGLTPVDGSRSRPCRPCTTVQREITDAAMAQVRTHRARAAGRVVDAPDRVVFARTFPDHARSALRPHPVHGQQIGGRDCRGGQESETAEAERPTVRRLGNAPQSAAALADPVRSLEQVTARRAFRPSPVLSARAATMRISARASTIAQSRLDTPGPTFSCDSVTL